MAYPQLDRFALHLHPLAQRTNRSRIEQDHIPAHRQPGAMDPAANAVLAETVDRIRGARARGRSVILAFGAHTIKNGLAPVLQALVANGWVTHLATNGAGIIHDWEFAFLGATSEHVAENVRQGRFGIWDETGRHINLALAIGAYEGRGYGESVGALIEQNGLAIPDQADLEAALRNPGAPPEHRAAAADLLGLLSRIRPPAPRCEVPHPYKRFSIQAECFRRNIPFTGHPMFGHDIIYTHPASCGAAIGRCAERDFLRFAHAVAGLEHGVYVSVGSAVMSPMIFEKSLSMAQNLALQHNAAITNHFIAVVDLAPSSWDWSRGEPPEHDPAYYLRYCKTFSRMGGTLRYAGADNRDFLLGLLHRLSNSQPAPHD